MKTVLKFIFNETTLLAYRERWAMIVCHCNGVSERAIRDVVRSGACSVRQVARACHAGRVCGGCHPAIREIIGGERDSEPLLARSEPLATTR
jgi:bacterioferritin-associated ferredoxin